MTYNLDAFATSDKYSSRVCPSDLVKQSPDGLVTIDQTRRTGCMLCIIGCPIGAIFPYNQVATKREYSNLSNADRYIQQISVPLEEKKNYRILH
jgi:Fe-S-cluster-containing dehydrogenase component